MPHHLAETSEKKRVGNCLSLTGYHIRHLLAICKHNMSRFEFINMSVLQSLLDLDFSIFRVWIHSVFTDTTVEITNCIQRALAYLL